MQGVTRAELCAISSSCGLMLLFVHSEQVLQYYQKTFFRINRVSRALQPSNRRNAPPYLKVNKTFCRLCMESGVRGKTALAVQLKESQKGDNKMAVMRILGGCPQKYILFFLIYAVQRQCCLVLPDTIIRKKYIKLLTVDYLVCKKCHFQL